MCGGRAVRHRHTRCVIDPLLGDEQPSEEEYHAARRWARQRAVLTIVVAWALGSVASWLIWRDVLTFEALAIAVPVWLCVPIWTRQKIARDRGLPAPRLY